MGKPRRQTHLGTGQEQCQHEDCRGYVTESRHLYSALCRMTGSKQGAREDILDFPQVVLAGKPPPLPHRAEVPRHFGLIGSTVAIFP